MISDLMLDVDNHYVQNLMLAAENVAEAKNIPGKRYGSSLTL
jgi:hypothetical protein